LTLFFLGVSFLRSFFLTFFSVFFYVSFSGEPTILLFLFHFPSPRAWLFLAAITFLALAEHSLLTQWFFFHVLPFALYGR